MAETLTMKNKTRKFYYKYLDLYIIKSSGFALPIVMLVGFFLLISGFSLSSVAIKSLISSKKSIQQEQSQNLAETGVAKMLSQLNSRYRYLLINCYRSDQREGFDSRSSCSNNNIGGWGQNMSPTPTVQGAACLGVDDEERNLTNYSDNIILREDFPEIIVNDKVQKNKGEWTLDRYTFYGDQFYGGHGTIKVRGSVMNSENKTLAETTIQSTFEVKSKPCESTLLENFHNNDAPGLLARSIDLSSDDVIGSDTANVYCTDCTSVQDLRRNDDSFIQGTINLGAIKLPKLPKFPSNLKQFVSVGNLTPTGEEAISIDSPNTPLTAFDPLCDGCDGVNHIRPAEGKPMCTTDDQKHVHCLINTIDIQSTNNITINSGNGERPVHIYLEGNLLVNSTASLHNADGDINDLVILGKSQNCSNGNNQSIQLNGSSSFKGFIYAPCADLTITTPAGELNSAECLNTNEQLIIFDNEIIQNQLDQCKKGDLEGAAWIGNWISDVGNNSAEITIPANLSELLIERFGPDFTAGRSDFVAVGVTNWSTSQ